MRQKGFTLIELVVVIVILGILSAVALPKFLNLSDKANDAALAGVAGALSSAAATNYAAKSAGAAHISVTAEDVCTSEIGDLLQGGFPNGYSISGPGDCSGAPESVSCVITKDDYPDASATATILCTNYPPPPA